MVLLSIETKVGNLFNSECQTLVNTVNCEGVMGAGIALEFKFRHSYMFDRYVQLCNAGQIDIGKLWLYKPRSPYDLIDDRWVLNFPTKRQWRLPSKREYLETGLEKFVNTYKERGIQSIAFPLLGAANGRFDEDESEKIMRRYLTECEIPVEIYKFDPDDHDELYNQLREWLIDLHPQNRSQVPNSVINAVREHDDIKLVSHLTRVKGVGSRSVQNLMKNYTTHLEQRRLDDAHTESTKSQGAFALTY